MLRQKLANYRTNMFYVDEILKKRGKFGLIWLAATGRKLNRRDVWSVDVEARSENVIEILETGDYSLEQYKKCYSLKLSSQLMYGLAKILSLKSKFAVEEAKIICNQLSLSKRPIEQHNINLPPTDPRHLNLLSPNMSDVSPGFGCLTPFPEPAQHLNFNYFLVTTPQSTPGGSEEELLHSPPGGLFGLPPMPEGAELLHTSAHGDVTMEEPIQEVQPEDPFGAPDEGNVDLLTGPMGFLVPDDVPEQAGDVPREEISAEPDQPQQSPPHVQPSPPHVQPSPPQPQLSPPQPQPSPPHPQSPIQLPPQPPGGALPYSPPQGSVARGSGSSEGQGPPDVPGAGGSPVPLPAPPRSPDSPEGRRPSPPADDDDQFVLDPVIQPGPGRRRRKRRLVVDRVIVINPDEMRSRMREQADNDDLFRGFREEIERPRFPTVAELLGRFNTRVVPAPFRDVFQRLRTLQEPNIPNFHVVDEEEEPSAVVPEPPVDELPMFDLEAPDLQPPVAEQINEEQPIEEDIFDNEVERQRARETFEATMDPSAQRMITGSSLRVPDASSATLLRTRDITVSPGRPSMLNFDDDTGLLDLNVPRTRFDRLEDLREAEIAGNIREPEGDIDMADVSEQQEVPAPKTTRAPVCQYSPVSPVIEPPPPSYLSLTHPLEELLGFIQHKATFGPVFFEELIIGEIGHPPVRTPNATPRTKKEEKKKWLEYNKWIAMLFNLVIHLAKEQKILIEQVNVGPPGQQSIRISVSNENRETREQSSETAS